MHPGFFGWWKQHHGEDGGEAEAHCGHGRHGWHGRHEWGGPYRAAPDFDPHGGGFGVRRPLRFLAHKLELSDQQVAELARILDELKIERAQDAVDTRRTSAAFADAMEGDTLDAAALGKAADDRVESARRLRDAVVKALGKIHALLSPDQRKQLAHLIRTGALTV
jgi:Spy/CpxP family protein refolding chaperone